MVGAEPEIYCWSPASPPFSLIFFFVSSLSLLYFFAVHMLIDHCKRDHLNVNSRAFFFPPHFLLLIILQLFRFFLLLSSTLSHLVMPQSISLFTSTISHGVCWVFLTGSLPESDKSRATLNYIGQQQRSKMADTSRMGLTT